MMASRTLYLVRLVRPEALLAWLIRLRPGHRSSEVYLYFLAVLVVLRDVSVMPPSLLFPFSLQVAPIDGGIVP